MKQQEEETGTTRERLLPEDDEASHAELDEQLEADEETSRPPALRPRSPYPNFKRLWLVAACVFLLSAIFSLWRGYTNAAFVTAALGIASWFLNVRSHMQIEE